MTISRNFPDQAIRLKECPAGILPVNIVFNRNKRTKRGKKLHFYVRRARFTLDRASKT